MSEYNNVVEKIASLLDETKLEGGIEAKDIGRMVADRFGDKINCYPGNPSNECFELALFVSLTQGVLGKGRGHLSFKDAVEKIVQHMQGACSGKTKSVVFITDSWGAVTFKKWQSNLEAINVDVKIEIYLLSGRSVSKIFIG